MMVITVIVNIFLYALMAVFSIESLKVIFGRGRQNKGE